MRTEQAINDEIAKLEAIKPTMLKKSAFGDNHHDAIDAQIDVLRNRLTSSRVEEHYGDDSSPAIDDDEEDFEDDTFAQNVYEAAIEANRWLFEHDDALPSDGWTELINAPAPAALKI